jgi:hypothetical protein
MAMLNDWKFTANGLLKSLLGIFRWTCLLVVLVIFFTVLSYKNWRSPVHIKVTHLEKVVLKEDFIDHAENERRACAKFSMTPTEFEQYFSRSQHLRSDELEHFNAGGCYYKTRIGKLTYVLWMRGLAEIRDGSKTEYYGPRIIEPPAVPYYSFN